MSRLKGRYCNLAIIPAVGMIALCVAPVTASASTSTTRPMPRTQHTSTTSRVTTTTRALAPSGVSLSTPDITPGYGHPTPVTVIVACTPGATGQVSMVEGGSTVASGTLSSGRANLTLTGLTGGSHVLAARYGGSASCGPATSRPSALLVAPAKSTIVVATNASAPVHGQEVTFTATLTRVTSAGSFPTGSVSFRDGVTPIINAPIDITGVAAAATTELTVGTHHIIAEFEGDLNYAAGEAEVTVAIEPASTETTASSLDRTNVSGEPTRVEIHVQPRAPGRGTPTGRVELRAVGQVLDSARLDDAGLAHLSSTRLAPGNHELIAVYRGDGEYEGSAGEPVTVRILAGDVKGADQSRPRKPQPTHSPKSSSTGLLILLGLLGLALFGGGAAGLFVTRALLARTASHDIDEPGVEGLDPKTRTDSDAEPTDLEPGPNADDELMNYLAEQQERDAELLALLAERVAAAASAPIQVPGPDGDPETLEAALARLGAASGDPTLRAMLRGAFNPLGANGEDPGTLGDLGDDGVAVSPEAPEAGS